ncbi:uncharacterized protein [Eucyclogobius newberryi]|uniref:uncharacterized protein n=1 Tax=Eucyclogobius newberryi TaxID=166745 RepID=UPI003B5C3747
MVSDANYCSSPFISSFLKTMSTLNELRSIIQRTLPTCSEETQENIMERLVSSGIDCIDDLKYLQQEDIKDVLPVIQQRKLMEAFKMVTESITLNLEDLTCALADDTIIVPIPSPCSSSSSSSCHPFSSESEESPGTSQILKTWPETFQVPWNLMPADIQSAIVEEKKASPGGRRQMVRIIADKMRKNELNPTRAQCAVVCRNIVIGVRVRGGDTGGNCIRQWKVSLEGSIVSDGIQPTFGTGLAAVFSTYYNFNLEYPDEAVCTLEFIQRRYIGINPERGTKITRGEVVSKKNGKVTVKKTSTVNPRVSTLLRKLMDFEWDFI